jgi:hypothetical protein
MDGSGVTVLPINDAGVTSVAISPNGQLVAAGSLDNIVRIWDVATGSLVERLRGHRDSVYSVAFTPDGKGLVSGSLDKTLKYWDVSGLIMRGIEGGAQGSAIGPGSAPGSADGRKDFDKSSQCTMNFTGHKVCVVHHCHPSKICSTILRTTYSLLLFHMTANGLSRDRKIERSCSGILVQRWCSVWSRVIKTRVSPLVHLLWSRSYLISLFPSSSNFGRPESSREHARDGQWRPASSNLCASRLNYILPSNLSNVKFVL